MPGNRSGQSFPEKFRDGWSGFETTELPLTDDLNDPTEGGLVEQMERLASKTWGAGASFLMTGGSSLSASALLTALIKPGSTVLFLPTAHRSFLQAASWLDLRLKPLPMKRSEGEATELPILDVEKAVKLVAETSESLAACWMISPDYFGHVQNLIPLAESLRDRGILLLVDEAHGAHYALSPKQFPPTALDMGADGVVQSLHKTLPVLAPASMIHLSQRLIQNSPACVTALARARRVWQTTSPSFPVAASVDWMQGFLTTPSGQAQMGRTLEFIRSFREKNHVPFRVLHPTQWEDPFRVVIDVSQSAWTGQSLAAQLAKDGIDVEMATETHLILIVAMDQPESDFQRLECSLQRWAKGKPSPESGVETSQSKNQHNSHDPYPLWISKWNQTEGTVRPREAFLRSFTCSETLSYPDVRQKFEKGETLEVLDSITPYPPGIPLFYPGEVLDRRTMEILEKLFQSEAALSGCSWDALPVMGTLPS